VGAAPVLPSAPVRSILFFLLAGLCEIGGGYLVWIWLRERKPLAIGLAGMVVLALYGVVPTFQPPQNGFGRIYAAYGAVFIVLSVLWGWWIDGQRPDLRDGVGALICLAGAAVMMWPRAGT
jgi:small multidrug resistance family-3 protein